MHRWLHRLLHRSLIYRDKFLAKMLGVNTRCEPKKLVTSSERILLSILAHLDISLYYFKFLPEKCVQEFVALRLRFIRIHQLWNKSRQKTWYKKKLQNELSNFIHKKDLLTKQQKRTAIVIKAQKISWSFRK